MQNYLLNINRKYDCNDICFQENNTDCFKICQYYYYLNESNDYICTKSENCVDDYNKLIVERSLSALINVKKIIFINMNMLIFVIQNVQKEQLKVLKKIICV